MALRCCRANASVCVALPCCRSGSVSSRRNSKRRTSFEDRYEFGAKVSSRRRGTVVMVVVLTPLVPVSGVCCSWARGRWR